MRIKAIYVITSSGRDFFSTMTRVSVASLRIACPEVQPWIACDSITHQALVKSDDPLLQEVDHCLVQESDFENPVLRNRDIKTNLRNLTDGPFLFLDSDILIRKDISEVFQSQADIAAATNHSKDRLDDQIWDHDRGTLNQMGWNHCPDIYINGGFLWYNDTPAAHQFATRWHENWKTSSEHTNDHRDQPALNHSLNSVQELKLQILPHKYNAQFRFELNSIEDAAVWHYYSSASKAPVTAFEILVVDILNGSRDLKTEDVKALMNRPHPWRRDHCWDDWIARSIQKNGKINVADQIWLEGRRWESIRYRIRNPKDI